MIKRGNKRAAMEMSIGTVVVIVLAMSMLILGLVLVQGIFKGAKYNIDQLNNKVTDEINMLFTEESKIVMYLANKQAEIKQGDNFGVAFGIKNTQTGVTGQDTFTYEITADDPDLQTRCGITKEEAESWVYPGRTGSFAISPGEVVIGLARFQIPEGSTLCTIRYSIDIRLGGEPYAPDFFDITIK